MRYCKESTDNPDHVVNLIRDGKDVGLGVLVGTEMCMGMSLWAGAVGLVALGVNIDPQVYLRGFAAAQKREAGPVLDLDLRLIEFRRDTAGSGDCWLSGTKYYLSKLGLGSERLMPPLQPASERRNASSTAS